MLVDYHMHLIHDSHEDACPYALDRVEQYLRVAESQGIHEIGISEHCDRFVQFQPVMEHLIQGDDTYPAVTSWLAKRFYEQLDEYVETLVLAKQRGWPVCISLEVDYIAGAQDAIREILQPYPWDYILGSVHFLGKWGIDVSPSSGWPERNVDDVYDEYFTHLQAAAETQLFDVLAHPDLVKKFGHKPSKTPIKHYENVAEAAQKHQVAVEISTAGLRRGEEETYPAPQFLRILHEAGVPITFGPDDQYPGQVGDH